MPPESVEVIYDALKESKGIHSFLANMLVASKVYNVQTLEQ